MKKTGFICIAAICLLAFQAKGQSSVGVKTDVNLSDFLITQSSNVKIKAKAGGSAGFSYKYQWSANRAVITDLMFSYRASKTAGIFVRI